MKTNKPEVKGASDKDEGKSVVRGRRKDVRCCRSPNMMSSEGQVSLGAVASGEGSRRLLDQPAPIRIGYALNQGWL
jgi:hypothetical protein